MKKVALITGASSGIGAELARIHAAKGGDLVLVARRKEKLNKIKTDLEQNHGVKAKVIVKDLTLPEAPAEIYTELKNEEILIDYLINNAGFGGRGKFHERAWATDLAMINLNIVALTALTRLFLPDFVKRNTGKVLNVSSTASLVPGPLQAVYYATKAYVTSFSNALTGELHDTKVTVTALLPGATETEFEKTAGLENTDLFKNTFSAKGVAESGYKAMIAGKTNVMAGLSFTQRLMMASVPFVPKKMTLNMIRQMQEVK